MAGDTTNGQIWSIESILGAFIGPPVADVLIALAVPIPFAVNAVSFGLTAWLVWNIVTVSYRQRLIPDDLLGRVNSIHRFFGWGMIPFGALAAGILVSVAEPEWGRELALRVPFIISVVGLTLMYFYGRARLYL